MRTLTATVLIAVLTATIAGAAEGAKHKQPEGGAMQRTSLEGCMNQWLFNGVWRLRADSVAPVNVFGRPGFAVNVEARNGTTKTLQPGLSGIQGAGQGVTLVLDSGDELPVDAGAFQNDFGYKPVVQGGTIKSKLQFLAPNGTDLSAKKPVKMIVQFDQKNVGFPPVRYSVKNPSMRIKLTCDKASA